MSQADDSRSGNVRIENMGDGSVIEGEAAVAAYLQQEQELLAKYGSSLIFQIYRLTVDAATLDAFQGPQLGSFKVDGEFVAADDNVAMVKRKLYDLLVELAQEQLGEAVAPQAEEQITLYFDANPLADENLFYADHPIMLPAWVQVLLHEGSTAAVVTRIQELAAG